MRNAARSRSIAAAVSLGIGACATGAGYDAPRAANNPPVAATHHPAKPKALDPADERTVAAQNEGSFRPPRTGQTLTASDQSNAPDDRHITASLRQSIVGDSSLSWAAKNVTIVTIKGAVTLKGLVKSEAERATIAAKAQKVAGVTSVENLLGVKP